MIKTSLVNEAYFLDATATDFISGSKMSFSVSVKKGDVFSLVEGNETVLSIEIEEDHSIEFTGNLFKGVSNEISSVDCWLSNYIIKSFAFNKCETITHFTEIGGINIAVNGLKLIHLSNGYGDGRFTLRFKEGILYRNEDCLKSE